MAAVADLSDALTKAATDFSASLSENVQAALSGIDPSVLEASLTTAVQAVDTSLAVTPDTSALTGDITEAVAAADTTVTIEGDPSALPSEVESALAEASTTVVLEGDGSAVTTEGDTAVQAIDPTVVLQADTSQLVDQGNAAAQSVNEAQISNVATGVGNSQGIIASGTQVAAEAEGINLLSGATQGLSAANAGLEGSVGGVTSALGPLGASIAGVTALAGGFFTEAVNEETALNRLNFVYGANVAAVQQVTLADNNFNLSLQQIATTTGASLPGLENAASRIGAIGYSAGAGAPQIAETAKQILAIATYLAVTNPALGTADQIANQLTNTLQRGGRSASLLGLSLPTKELNAAAQAVAGAGNEVTQFDKIQAGAAIVSGQLGTSLGTAVTAGANEAALALPKLTETLKETVAAVGTPLIGPITSLFTQIAPPLEQVVTAIGHLLVAAAPLGVVLGIVLKVLGDLASIITLIPVPILTTAIVALTGAMAVNAAVDFAAGLFTLGAAATADVGIVGLLTAAVDALEVALGPVGLAIIALTAGWAISSAIAKNNATNATAYAQSLIGVKAGTDLATESTATLNQQLGTVTSKIADLKSQIGGVGGFFAQAFGFDDAKIAQIKALTDEEAKLKSALAATNSAAGDTSGTEAATKAQQDFATAIQTSASKLDGIGTALASVESANASLVSGAVSKMPGVAGVFGDVSSAIDAAAKAADKQASSSGSASSALATQATHAKDLRDATAALNTAEENFSTLAAGPDPAKFQAGLDAIAASARTVRDDIAAVNANKIALDTLTAGPSARDLEASFISAAAAAKTTSDAEQKVYDIKAAIDALAHPTADTTSQADENVAKATLDQQKAVLGLADARTFLQKLKDAGTASDRQILDATNNIASAQFVQTDADRSLSSAIAARAKITSDAQPGSAAMKSLTDQLADAQLSLRSAQDSQNSSAAASKQIVDDSLPGSAAILAATNKWSDSVAALDVAERAQNDTQAKQTQLIADSLPGSEALLALQQKVSDAEDHLTSVVESGSAKQASAAASAAKTHVDALSALSQGLDEQIAAENKFYSDLQKIQAEGGTEIVAELLAQGPKTGAAEATAVAGATVTIVAALETKAETLKADEDKHAQDIATIFGASLNANLVKAFSTQLKNETDFFANLHTIFEAGGIELVKILATQGPAQAGATAAAIASGTPTVIAALEAQAEQLKAKESTLGTDVGTTFGSGLFAGINAANDKVFAAAAALGTTAKAGTASTIKPGSPSLVAMELGSQWAEGLALGVTGGIPLVVSAATQLASALVVSPNAPALSTGSTVAATGGVSSAPGSVVQNVTVNEVAQNPAATAFAVSSRLAAEATR